MKEDRLFQKYFEYFLFFLLCFLYCSITFWILLPFKTNIPGFITFTLTKFLAFIYIIFLSTYLFFFKQNLFKFPREIWFLLWFAVIGIIVALFSNLKSANLKYAAAPVLGGLLLISIVFHTTLLNKISGVLKVLILCLGTVSLASGYLEFFSGTSFDFFFRLFRSGLLHWDFNNVLRVSGIFCDTNYMSNFFIFFIPFIFGFFILKSSGKAFYLYLALLTVSFQLLFLTYSRSNIFGLFFAFILFLVLLAIKKYFTSNIIKKTILVILIFIALYGSNFYFNKTFRERLKDSTSEMLNSERSKLQKAAIKMIFSSHFLGSGFAEFGWRVHNDPAYIFDGINNGNSKNIISPHSLYLGILQASGLAGLICFILFIMAYFKRLFTEILQDNIELCAIFIWLSAYLAAGVFGKEMYIIEDCIYFFLIVSLGYIYSKQVTPRV